MVERIAARDFSLLRAVDIELGPGLTVITGESGAGKTLIFDAAVFALGGRPHRSLLASGAKSCTVELALRLDERLAAKLGRPWRPGANSLKRRLSAGGRSQLMLNGETLGVQRVQEDGQRLMEITGQFESQVLFDPRVHLTLLDSFGEAGLAPKLADYRGEYARLREVRALLATLEKSAAERAQEVDFLSYQVHELEAAKVQAGERADVEGRQRVAENAANLISAAGEAGMLLGGSENAPGAYDLAAQAAQRIAEIRSLVGDRGVIDAGELAADLEALMEQARDLAGHCSDIAQSLTHDPAEAERLRERLDELNRLERKYGHGADELPTLLEEKKTRLAVLTEPAASPEALAAEAAELSRRVESLGGELSTLRRKAAERMVKETRKYFRQLDFPQVELQVDLERAGQPGPDGLDTVEVLITLNPGEPPRPLAQVASGGEASRLLLGLKAALAGRLGFGAMLLDEVEAGLGADTAMHVADVLAELGRHRQVLAITHLPVVAARGAAHLVVRKELQAGRSSVVVEAVAGERRTAELARMLGGTGSAEEAALVARMLTQG